MGAIIHTIKLLPDWNLITKLSQIDKFGGSWTAIEKREGQTLKQLKSIATVRSVGASTRIEGSKMTDDEVEALIKNLEVSKLEERDAQEVIGYYETLDIISESFRDIDVSENNLKMLHNILMKHSEKDVWHRGNYKQHSNVVEATNADGTKYVIFRTTDPGFATEDAMRQLIHWYNTDTTTHPIIRVAIFVYDFLSIHPFQDGNGRLSRLLATLLLLRQNYSWIQYVSFEHEIESRKTEYYTTLMQCQRQRPGEDVYPWATFFLSCLTNIQNLLMDKLQTKNSHSQLSPREKKLYSFIENHPGSKSGEIALKLALPLPTVKRTLIEMIEKKMITKHGVGKGTNYTSENTNSVKKNLVFNLKDGARKKEFLLTHSTSVIEIKKVIVNPLFEWSVPEDWKQKLVNQNLTFKVTCENNAGGQVEMPARSITSMISLFHFNPVLTLSDPIHISAESIWERTLRSNEYPIKATIELCSETAHFDFDVMFVYDEAG